MTSPEFPTAKYKVFILDGSTRTRHPLSISIIFEHGTIRGVGQENAEIFSLHGCYDSKARECRWTEIRQGHKVSARGFRDAMQASKIAFKVLFPWGLMILTNRLAGFAVGFTIRIVPNPNQFVEWESPSGHCKKCIFLSADFGRIQHYPPV